MLNDRPGAPCCGWSATQPRSEIPRPYGCAPPGCPLKKCPEAGAHSPAKAGLRESKRDIAGGTSSGAQTSVCELIKNTVSLCEARCHAADVRRTPGGISDTSFEISNLKFIRLLQKIPIPLSLIPLIKFPHPLTPKNSRPFAQVPSGIQSEGPFPHPNSSVSTRHVVALAKTGPWLNPLISSVLERKAKPFRIS